MEVSGPARRPGALPTRVNRACERCRRNKTRCDSYRPCSLCLRADASCPAEGDSTSDDRPDTVRPQSTRDRENSYVTSSRRPSKRVRTTSTTSSNQWDAVVRQSSQAPSSTNQFAQRDLTSPHDEYVSDHHEAESTMGIARKIYRLDSQHFDEQTVTAIPGAIVDDRSRSHCATPTARASTGTFLIHDLPPADVRTSLLEEYFESIHWFSLVIYEPKFRKRLRTIQDGRAGPNQKPFLLLLSTVLGLAAWYKAHKARASQDNTADYWDEWSSRLIKNAESHLAEILDQCSIAAVQTIVLLGTLHVYHGRPNLSFALLGASIKSSQAMKLHREASGADLDDAEERKRLWWTVYTWDRFASITYGRPLGIIDRDCNTSMPSDIIENVNFADPAGDRPICFSAYQRELNILYMIASPAIARVYGTNPDGELQGNNAYLALVRDVTTRLWHWRHALPTSLSLDLDTDYEPDSSPSARVHSLQALSLQLTFDSLLIILHRPFLTQQIESLQLDESEFSGVHQSAESGSTPYTSSSIPDLSTHQIASSTQQWWQAAVRTSKVTELPLLAQLATDSHLVAFLAINLFNAAIVMVVMALCDPLSDQAQDAKKAITRIYRLQELLGRRNTLSSQSSHVLRSVIHLLLRREAQAILRPSAPRLDNSSWAPTASSDGLSVQATMSMPFSSPPRPGSNMVRGGPSGLISASNLNKSLASVQKAFATVPNPSHARQPQPMEAPPQPLAEVRGVSVNLLDDDAEFGNDAGSENLEIFQSDFQNLGDENNGFYWFWDPEWNDPPC